MAGVQHLSMRVPWRDRAWDSRVCDDPLGNSSCTLLASVGANRDDQYERANPGAAFGSLDAARLPCLSERATFMSADGYRVVKNHPYAQNKVLKGTLHPSVVSVPGYAFEAVPFRWLNRQNLHEVVGEDQVPGFSPAAERAVDNALSFSPPWVMDGQNQQAVMAEFFAPVAPGDSLVFMYLKHSPLQEGDNTGRLLVGAARVSSVTSPPMWNQTGTPPFESAMWETIVGHSLRPDMADGILLPYQSLVGLMDDGVDVGPALAWAPEGRDVEFSYVTEHVSDDAAIQALTSLLAAGTGAVALGLAVPAEALAWVQDEIDRLWQVRGPVPGLSAVLGHLGVERPEVATRAVLAACGDITDPWDLLKDGFGDRGRFSPAVARQIGRSVSATWSASPTMERDALMLLSGMDISADQVSMLMGGETDIELEVADLIANPYWASICTYGGAQPVPFTTIDRACFPPAHVTWRAPLPDSAAMDDRHDRRRLEALLVDVLESRADRGDTLLPEDEALDIVTTYPLTRAPALTPAVLRGAGLDAESLDAIEDWSPLHSVRLAGGQRALKCRWREETSETIREWVADQRGKRRFANIADARSRLDATLRDLDGGSGSDAVDPTEERARSEKAVGLAELHASPLSVLIGPAGTGKTTLLRALAALDDISRGSLLLLTPTGKARVQLQTKVGHPAQTLASFLIRSGRYEDSSYRVTGDEGTRRQFDMVVVDEASMLTEEMLAATLDALRDVKRLVLVGDPRQLPPIGAGRPFVDLVAELEPEVRPDGARVSPGYVDLTVTRRQRADGSGGPRDDLDLARWFGERVGGAAEDDVWDRLRASPSLPSLVFESWGGRSPVEALAVAMERFLPGLADADDPVRAFAQTYGAEVNGKYTNWEPSAGRKAEEWQILSTTRSRASGTTELNRYIKRTYRSDDLGFARKYLRANTPSPIGPEQIVRGDKVMQTRNARMRGWPKSPDAIDFVANGEIGVGIGRIVPSAKMPKPKLALQVEFASQPGVQYSYWPTSQDDPPLELAWAVTVHKSQGSEFGTTFVVLPKRTSVSRELMYTALTRQRDRVVILHEGTVEDLRELSHPWNSETARRLTDLFTAAQPLTLARKGVTRRFDRNHLHVTAGGVPVASKNEVIIAQILDDLVPGHWDYEKPFTGGDGRTVLPDFTISLPDGRTVYWEHAGMLDLPDYRRKWGLKRDWFLAQGIAAFSDTAKDAAADILLWTDDREGVDAQAWKSLAESVFGSVARPPTAGGGPNSRPRRRGVKRASGRKTRD